MHISCMEFFWKKIKKGVDKTFNTYYNKYCKDKTYWYFLVAVAWVESQTERWKDYERDTIVVIGEALVSVVAEIWKDRNEKKEGESDS